MTLYLDHTNGAKEIDLDADASKTKWLLEQGYISPKTASKAKDAGERGKYATSVPASDDPTLAENREKPVPVDQIKPHLANENPDQAEGETTLGKSMGLDAKVDKATAPAVKVTSHKDAGQGGAVEHPAEQVAFKKAIDKEQGPAPEPSRGTGEVEEPESTSLKGDIDKVQPVSTPGSPR